MNNMQELKITDREVKFYFPESDEKFSNCCGTPAYSNGDSSSEDYGYCRHCQEHCEYETELTEATFDPYHFELWARQNGIFETSDKVYYKGEYVADKVGRVRDIHEFLEFFPKEYTEAKMIEYFLTLK